MSDEQQRDESTGQFTQSTEDLHGKAYEQALHGFKPMELFPEKKETELTAHEAAEQLAAERGATAEDEKIVVLDAKTGEALNDDPSRGVVESMSVDDAALLLKNYHSQKEATAASSISADFAAEVDRMRADAIKGDPKKAEHYGLDPALADKAEVKPENRTIAEGADVDDVAGDIDPDGAIDPKLAEQIRTNPHVRQFIESEVAETHQSREAYSQGLEHARVHALASLAEIAPDLAGLPPQLFEQGLAALSQIDPPAFQKAMNVLSRVHTIAQAQEHVQQQAQQHQRQQFEHQRQQYSKQSEAVLGDMTAAEKFEMANELVDYVGDFGITREQLIHEAQNNLALNHPAFQRMASDALKYQRLMKSPKPTSNHALPPVLRPGVAAPRGSGESGPLHNAAAAFDRAPSLKTAAALVRAQRAQRER